jgi:chitinase
MRRVPSFVVAGAAAIALIASGPALSASASPHSGHPVHHSLSVRSAAPLPAHVSAPYVDVTAVSDLAKASAQSGSKYLTLAFLQTDAPGSCTVYWAGDTSTPVAASTFGAQINQIRRTGGDVIPSFGGYSADTTNTEIADSCTDVHKIALAYENVVTTYKAQRLDFDIEADSLSNTAGIDRRNQAIHEVEGWAAHHGRHLTIAYTLPSTPQGLGATGVDVLQSAATFHANVRVNVMTFDYYDGLTHDMVADAETAATGLVTQLQQTVAPHTHASALWPRIGVIQMIGIDDYGPAETFTAAEAAPFIAWAKSKHLNEVSFWALERDNGTCVGTKGANACSGVAQDQWAFSRAFAKFTSRRR